MQTLTSEIFFTIEAGRKVGRLWRNAGNEGLYSQPLRRSESNA